MQNIELNEGQEFFIGGQRYVVKDGAPVQEVKRGPLGGELVEFKDLKDGDLFWVQFIKSNWGTAQSICGHQKVTFLGFLNCEINVPQPQQSGRVMAAGEAARLPDIVGKRVAVRISASSPDTSYCLAMDAEDDLDWIEKSVMVEVLD